MNLNFRMLKRIALRVRKAFWRMYWTANDWVYWHLHVTISEIVFGVSAVLLWYFIYWLSGIIA